MKRFHFSAALFASCVAVGFTAETACYAQAQRGPRGQSSGDSRFLDGVAAHRDVAYIENGHERQTLDIYLPKASEPLPVVIWVHGGGWQGGSKDGCPPLRAGYATTTGPPTSTSSLRHRVTSVMLRLTRPRAS